MIQFHSDFCLYASRRNEYSEKGRRYAERADHYASEWLEEYCKQMTFIKRTMEEYGVALGIPKPIRELPKY